MCRIGGPAVADPHPGPRGWVCIQHMIVLGFLSVERHKIILSFNQTHNRDFIRGTEQG